MSVSLWQRTEYECQRLFFDEKAIFFLHHADAPQPIIPVERVFPVPPRVALLVFRHTGSLGEKRNKKIDPSIIYNHYQ